MVRIVLLILKRKLIRKRRQILLAALGDKDITNVNTDFFSEAYRNEVNGELKQCDKRIAAVDLLLKT